MLQALEASRAPIAANEFDDSVIDPFSVRALFAAVIERAFLDACWPKVSDGGFYNRIHRDAARQWLSTPSKDLALSCMGAGLDYESVLAKGKALSKIDWPMPQALRAKASTEKSTMRRAEKLAA